MLKILTSAQLKQLDQDTISRQKISPWELMERASTRFVQALQRDVDLKKYEVIVICGPGNNGGDGLAIARHLSQHSVNSSVYLIESERYSADNRQNQQLLLQETPIRLHYFTLEDHLEIPENALIIDALFGFGLHRPLDSTWHPIITKINKAGGPIIAVDLPSGLLADAHTPHTAPIICAQKVYTFVAPKLALLFPSSQSYCDTFEIIDIDSDTQSARDAAANWYYLQGPEVAAMQPTPGRFSHKGTFGHALLIGGSYGKMGAVVLSAKAALRTGCGLLSTYVPRCGYPILQSAVAEAMVICDSEEQHLKTLPLPPYLYRAIGVGMGMGTENETQDAFKTFLLELDGFNALVLDADALNILALHHDWINYLPVNTILTPHPKELQRLIGTWSDDFEKLEKTKAFCKKYDVVCLIKGANTSIITPEGHVFFNSTGNWGMATGGSGDVLTGMITSLRAQGLAAVEAALTGVYLHGLAGDKACEKLHPKSLTASDIVDSISKAWRTLLPYNIE